MSDEDDEALAAALLPKPQRACGSCSLCCKLLPIIDIGKVRGAWCQHIGPNHRGCTIYDARPKSCRLWSCAYLFRATAPEELRPSRCHVVIDILSAPYWKDGKEQQAFQLWVDPAYPDAHRAPAIRTEITKAAEKGMPTIARIGIRALFIVAPALSGEAEWIEQESRVVADPDQDWEMQKIGTKLPERIR